MDDRQYALLARQPSAALQNRERFCGMPKRGLAFLLANVMFWQPMWAQAGGIVVSAPGTSLGQAGNGVPIVNIAKPNGNGLSHNRFKDYNVGSNGVILNNATGRTQSTQLGGIILGNPNLNGAAATTILNEVNGGSPSQLRGYTEVAGQSAHVIVANPYGITCNGCGFINTPRATLTTGKPIVENGQVSRYQVDQGNVTVEGAGLNATNVDRFEIITRSAKINAEIQAKNLTIIAGRNDVDVTNLNATARADDGSVKPQLAIDSSALGGMYAGAIRLVGTEAGVGVKLDGKLIASGGDIQLDANGHLSMVDTSATGAVTAKAASANVQGAVYGASVNVQTSGALDVQQSIAARDQISLSSGGQLTNNGVIEAGVNADSTRNAKGDVSLTAQHLNNSGKSVVASRNLTANVAQTLNNQGGTLSAGQASVVKAGTLDNQNNGRVLSNKTLTVTADTLLNTQGVVSSNGNLTATVGQLNNHDGEVSSAATTQLIGSTLDNSDGLLSGDVALNIGLIGALNNRNGVLGSGAKLTVTAASLDNHAGQIQSAQDMQLTVGVLDNSQQGLLSSQAGLRVDGTQLNNTGGLLTAVGPVHLETTGVDNSGGRISSQTDLTANVAQLTNQGGELVAQGLLTVSGQSLDNRNGGLVGATNALTLDVDAVDNRGGEISSSLGIDIDGERLDNSDNGKVLAGTDLGLKVAEIINQTKGLLFSTGTTTVVGKSLDNSGGSLVADQGLDIRLDNALTNVAGLISSEGTLSAKAGSLDNTQGSVSSAGALGLTLDNALLNQGGEILTDAGLTVKSASLDNRNNGTISGKQGVLVETGAFDNSQSGRLSSAASLDLTTQKLTNQDGGRIASNGALTANVTGLDQQGGQLFSNTALTLDLKQGQLNNQGGLINAPLLVLKNLKGVNNDGGEISSAQTFTLAAQSLNNDNGKLLSNQALTLRIDNALTNLKGLIAAAALDVEAASLNNSGGTLTSRANLDLALSGSLTNQSNGLISATDALNLHTSDLNNQQGSLLGSAIAIDFGAATGDLNNSAGLITTAGVLSLKHLRDLNNQHGEISSSQSLDLNARDLDNSAGQLISNGVLTVGARDVINQGGLLSGFKGLGLTATSLDNRNSGTLSSRDEDLSATLSGALLNGNAGALVGKKQLTVSAASLDNGGGILSSGGDQTLTVTDGLLNNAQGGLIDSGAALVINAMTLGNAGGTVNAQNALSFTGTDLDNTGGQLIGNAAVTLDLLGALTNTNGKIASAGPLRVERATQIDNQRGQIASQGLLTLLTAGLDNRDRGTVAANDQLVLTSTGTVQNDADGLIYSQNGSVQIDAASLTNGKGTVQSQGAMTLTVANDIDNQSGRLQAKAGDLMVVARNLDNRGGVLASLQGLLTTQLSGVLKNGYDLNNNRQGGITQAQRLNLIALGGLDNYGGRISAQTGDATVTTRNFDNRNGGLYAKGKVSVTANDFDNSGDNDGQIAGSQIDLDLTGALNNRLGIIESDSTLAIKAASLDNQTGQLRALGTSGKTEFQIGGLFDNRNGTLETANTDLTLGAASFLNTDGSLLHVGTGLFDISTANLNNAGGNLVTRGGLTLTADNWTNSSVIQAGRLTVNVNNLTQTSTGQLLASTSLVGSGGNWSNDGLIASDGSISLALGGSYGGSGRLSSLGGIDLTAAQLNLRVSSSIAGGDDSTVKVGGQLTNAGRLTSNANLIVQAGSLINSGTLGSARNLVLKTPSLLNDRGLVFSGADMTLGVGNLTNQRGDLYGLGNVVIGGYGGAPRAAGVYNISGSMESGGGFTINADAFENRTEGAVMSADRKLVSGLIAGSCGDCVGDIYSIYIMARETFQSTDSDTSASAVLNVGKDFTFQGGSFLNSKSTVAAGGNINITADTLKNIGAKSGTIERTTSYVFELTDGGTGRFFSNVVMPYNQRNNPDFPNVYYVVVGSENPIRKAIPKSVHVREGGRDGETYDTVSLTDTATGEDVSKRRYGRGLSGLSYGFETSMPSLYDPNNLLELPSQLTQYTPQSVVEVAVDNTGAIGTATGRNAIIQAGGNVSITAAKDLENSVIHEDYGSSGGTNKVVDTKVAGTTTAVVRINSQLPPDVAQQQVNPLTLPGFSLPTGENGLFRLSGIGKSDSSSVGPSPTWTIGGGAVTAQDHLVAAINGGVRDRVIDTSVAPSGSTRTVDTLNPTPTAPQVTANGPATRVTGLPNTTAPSNAHKYLIETNPVLTELKSFMSSDYLLQNLGYDPDQSAKRLGDGLYEQRLIQQAVVARTGQRFIDGQTTDEGLFKYLMNNAIASKQELGLSVGVTLTSEQVAALTHDIVWLEEHEVNGEKVLVPVLYLAQAEGRLGPTGALIAGKDVTLIAGQNLDNVGTLRASNNLSATAGKDLVNSGLVQAGNRLDVLAVNEIVNKSGGIIAGRDVNMTALTGDVLVERTLTSSDGSSRFGTEHHDYADNAARIEAANNLTLGAGRDINVVGGVLQSGFDMKLDADRDVNIVSTQVTNSESRGRRYNSSDITQLSASLDAGRDFSAQAGRDINVIASQVDAKRDIAMAATQNLGISSAADEEHSLSKSKKVTRQEDHVSQVMSGVTAGGDVDLSAGKDMALVSSRISAGDEAYLVAGENLDVLAAQDSDYSLYDKKKKGSFGKKQTRHDELTKVTNVSSQITTGGDLTLVSGDDQRYQAAKLESGNDLMLQSGGAIVFEGVKDLHDESHTKSNGDAFWTSSKGKGHTDETLRQTQIVAAGKIMIQAVDGLQIDIRQVNKETVSQSIDAMVKADPKLAWLKEAEARGDVDWRQVKEIHESFKYSNSGLGPASQLIIAIVMAAVVGPAALSAFASLGSIGAAGLAAVATGAATNATTSFINNGGNLGAVFQDVTSSDALKGYVISGVTAGLTAGVFDGMLKTTTNPVTGKVTVDLSSLDGVGRFAGNQILQGETSALLSKALGQGGSGSDALKAALFNTLAAASFNAVGGYTKGVIDDGSLQKIAIHAMVGGLLAKATGGDFKTGALAAGANEALVADLDNLVKGNENLLTMSSQIVGILAATTQKDVDASTLEKAAWIAKNASQYNRQLHKEDRELAQQLAARSGGKYTVEQIEEQLRLSNVEGTDIRAGDIVTTKDGIYDSSAKWVDLGNGQFVQQLAKPDLDLIAFIQASTSNYTWAAFPAAPDYDWSKVPNVSDEVRDRLSGRVLDAEGGFRSPVLVDGEAFNPRFLPCGDASCVASGGAIDLKDPETQRWISAGDAKAAKDALAVGALVPLPMAWVGKVLGSVFGRGVAREAIGEASLAAGAKEVGAVGQKLPSALPENLTGYANPKDIRFTQDSVSNTFKDGQTLQSTIDGLKSGKISPDDLPPIRVFEKDGAVYSLDNRRLLAASEAGVPIKVVPATPAEVAREGWKMTTPNNGSIICVRGVCK